MTPHSDDADYDVGEAFENVPSQLFNARNHDYYGRGYGTMYVPQGLPDTPIKLQKQGRTSTVKLKETATIVLVFIYTIHIALPSKKLFSSRVDGIFDLSLFSSVLQ
ncbi:unnamed protein product [Protopolystoma xenopodis]|uniref:Uncharacterized protein n=1 Tax=Protopolystoma xenopodis TaxID=117903 RepID=A0A3S5CH47_9PLAT|nr:unnamed protein product [Protopolystoma xenopodis]